MSCNINNINVTFSDADADADNVGCGWYDNNRIYSDFHDTMA